MKKYTIGLITGALLAISAMMFMGARDSERGKYQAFASEGRRYLLDTQSENYTVITSIVIMVGC